MNAGSPQPLSWCPGVPSMLYVCVALIGPLRELVRGFPKLAKLSGRANFGHSSLTNRRRQPKSNRRHRPTRSLRAPRSAERQKFNRNRQTLISTGLPLLVASLGSNTVSERRDFPPLSASDRPQMSDTYILSSQSTSMLDCLPCYRSW